MDQSRCVKDADSLAVNAEFASQILAIPLSLFFAVIGQLERRNRSPEFPAVVGRSWLYCLSLASCQSPFSLVW